jgi:hypothetical protein
MNAKQTRKYKIKGEQRYSSTLSLDQGVLSMILSGYFTPGKETRYPLFRMLDGPQDR